MFSKESGPRRLDFDFTPQRWCFLSDNHGKMEWWKNGILGLKNG
jgi:hypothetical protein